MRRRNIVPGVALFASASLFACSGGSPEREPANSPTTPSTMAPVSNEVSLGKDASQMPIRGNLDTQTCLTLKGLQVLLGKRGSSPVMVFGDASGRVSGQINVHGRDLEKAADALNDSLTSSGNIPADLAHADALAAVATTELAAHSVSEALASGPLSLEETQPIATATQMLEQARTVVAEAIQTGCHDTFVGNNFAASP